jgi:hypothetical protein
MPQKETSKELQRSRWRSQQSSRYKLWPKPSRIKKVLRDLITDVVTTTPVYEPHAEFSTQRHGQVPRSLATDVPTEFNTIDTTTNDPLDIFAKLVQKTTLIPTTTDVVTGRSNPHPTSPPLVASLQALTPSSYWTSLGTLSKKPKIFFEACVAIPTGHHNVKRKALFICGIIGATATLTRYCSDAIATIFRILFQHDDLTKRLANAANAALMVIATTAPFIAATYIRATVQIILAGDISKMDIALDLLHQWRLRASRCLRRVPIPARTWHDIITAIEAAPSPPRWNPEQGHVQWKSDINPTPNNVTDIDITD